jgi:formate hydrogenlyase transcriptional activator
MTLDSYSYRLPSPDKTLTLVSGGEKSGQAFVGNSHALGGVLRQIELVAPTASTVLIQGETGTGKELIARAIHRLSPRPNAPFVTLNCAAVPTALLESELFGHERGAFTGAVTQRIGHFERAHGGTLFLDEIGEVPLELQAKLLRVLQEQEFERLGAMRMTRVDVRIVAATNRDLWGMVQVKQFRADLFYRLSVFPLHAPPLRERREDIPALAHEFMSQANARTNKLVNKIPEEIMDAMMSYEWPGNIRQLQNFIEHGVIVSKGPEFLPPLEQLRGRAGSPAANRKTLDEATREYILQTLRETNGLVGGKEGAAARLGLARTTLLSKMRRLGIESHCGPSIVPPARAFASVA